MEMEKNYNPKSFEDRIYKRWENAGLFKADARSDKPPYSIVIPPPNITGQLHMGHALNLTYQDILIRFRRMQGFETLWLPGTDHASIATEAKVVEALKAEGKSKGDVGREAFLERTWQWRDEYGGRIVRQMRRLGASCDWERERFTLDEGCSRAVQKVFIDLYNQGKIYHGERIINWCPVCKTSISDIECEYEEKEGHFWHIKYLLEDGSGFIEIATTRPETLLGDTAVAVHPEDSRYKHLVGKNVILPLVNRKIPIVADTYVDREFGTGAVKITPAHDPNDFEVGQRHNLPRILVLDEGAVVNENGGVYAGLSRYDAREKIVADLKAAGLLVKIAAHSHNVGHCQRCHTVVEPMASRQWFVRMEELAKPANEAVKSGEIKMIPPRFINSYTAWMDNVRDWCVSRQLWWGHRIPAYYCQNAACSAEIISDTPVTVCPHCGAEAKQDEDTLDTWFSSALWPFSTLGWPEETDDYKKFYPTSTLVTAADIIFFWVARMIFSGLAYTGKAPFDTVMFNGIVRDADGKKMSKSSGNGVDPLEIIDKYGADALRLMLLLGNAPGNDMRWSEEKILASRNFANKLWNAARFVLMNLDLSDDLKRGEILTESLSAEDRWILGTLDNLVADVTRLMEQFELGVAVGKIYDFLWNDYCDWYIELVKPRLFTQAETADKQTARVVLLRVLQTALKLLHPFMPFITEEIFSKLPGVSQNISIMTEKFPTANPENAAKYEKGRADFAKIAEAIAATRSLRQELKISQTEKVEMTIFTTEPELFDKHSLQFAKLTGASGVLVKTGKDGAENDALKSGGAAAITDTAQIYILRDALDERARLEKERTAVQKDLDFLNKQLENSDFIAKAPAAKVDSLRAKKASADEKMAKILKSLKQL